MVRATQKGEMENPSPEVAKVAATTKRSSVKKFAKTKHKGLPEKKVTKESFNEDYVKELEDGLVKMDYPTYDEVDKLMCKIAKENDIDTTTLHMAFKTKHLMVPDDWAKKKMMEPVMIPKTPKITGDVKEELNKDDKPFVKKLVGKLRKGSKTHAKQADDLEKAMVSEKRKISDMEKKLYDRQKPSSDMITARAGEAKKQGELVDKYSKKYKTPTQKNETQKLLKGIARGEVHQESITAKQRFKRDAGAIAKKKIKQKEHNKYVNFLDVDEAVNAAQQAAIAISKRERLQDLKVAKKRKLKKEDYEPVISEKCWKGYEKKGMKTMFGKRYPNCVKKKGTRKEEYEPINELSQDTLNQAARQAMSKREAARGTPEFNKRQKQVEKFTNAASKKRKEIISKKDTLQKSFDKPDAQRTPTMEGNLYEYDGNYHMNKIAKEKGLDLTDPRQRRRANSLARKNAAKGNVNNPAGFSKRKKRKKMQTEGNLHQWFKGSKSKDGKGGWVNVVTGGTCASDKPGEGTPKCVSSSKRASMTKAERLSAQRRKKKADPNQQSKTGAAKPTYVKTDSPRKKKKVSEENINELKTRTMLNYIDKASDSASKQLDKANKTTSRKKEAKARLKMDSRERGIEMAKDKIMRRVKEETISEAGARVGRKFSMGKVGKQYGRDEYGDPIKKDGSSALKKNVDKNPKDDKTPNTLMGEAKSPAWQRKAGKSESGGLNAKGVASYRAANPGSKLKTAVTTKPSKLKKGSKSAKRRLSFCRRMRGMKKKLTSAKTARDPDSRINKSLRKWNCSFEPETGEMIMERGPQVLGSGARQKSIHAKTGKKGTKKVSGMIKSLKRKGSILKQPLGGPADAAAKARRLSYVKDDVDLTILRFIDEGHMNKTCGKGEYYCYQSKKCKDIPKGMKIGYGGMLKPIENEKDESNGKKGGSNGNGNGNGGNGNGNGGNGNGGNGGGNGGGE